MSNLLFTSKLLCSQAETPAEPETPDDPEDPEGWQLKGLLDDPQFDEFKRRHKHTGRDKFSLAAGLRQELPQLNRAGLSVARDFVNGKTTRLPFTFFEKTFPTEAQDIILREVTRVVVFLS